MYLFCSQIQILKGHLNNFSLRDFVGFFASQFAFEMSQKNSDSFSFFFKLKVT